MASLQSCLKRTPGSRVAPRRSRSACTTSAKLTLYDAPLSNFSARVRYVIRRKGLEGEVDIVSPQALGGLKSPEYLRINPQGKMPVLVLDDGHTSLPESEVRGAVCECVCGCSSRTRTVGWTAARAFDTTSISNDSHVYFLSLILY